jgi:hypothetical protein
MKEGRSVPDRVCLFAAPFFNTLCSYTQIDRFTEPPPATMETTASMTSGGTPVRSLRSTFIPGEDTCDRRFEGPSSGVVATASARARLPYERIGEATRIAAEDLR